MLKYKCICLINNKRGENLKETLRLNMKQVKTQTRIRETDFKSVLKSFLGIDEEEEFDLYDNTSEIGAIEKMQDISEEDKKIIITSLKNRDKLANKLFSNKSKARRKKASINIDTSKKQKKEEKYNILKTSKANKNIIDKERGE